jgi:hypothetical protein
MKPTFLKGVALGAATSVVVTAGTVALAGTGVGGLFNLGETNTVDQTSALLGTVAGGPQLQVINQGSGVSIRGESGPNRGVFGRHTNNAGTTPGVEGETNSNSAMAAGVVGRVPATAGASAAGVRGINPSTQADRYGVWGSVAGSGNGVFGQATGGSGVLGEATTGAGVLGVATTGIAVRALSQSGRGVDGRNLSGTRSVNGDQPGVYGTAGGDDGGQFSSNTGLGVRAQSSTNWGLYAFSFSSDGVVGESGAGGKAGVIARNQAGGPGLSVESQAGVSPMRVSNSVKVEKLNADLVDGLHSTQLVTGGSLYWRSSPLSAGTKAGGGACGSGDTCYVTQGCDPGDLPLSGGWWGLDAGSTVMASRPLNVGVWQVAVINNSTVDSILVNVWCADVTP